MKVLHVAETIKGGVAVVLRQLMSHPDNNRQHCLIPDVHLVELKGVGNERISTFRRSGRNVLSLYNMAFKFIWLVYNERPDIIHLHSSFAGVVCRLLLPFIYVIYRPKVIYCPHAFAFLMKTHSVNKKIFSWLERVLSLVTHKIICTSEYEKKMALQHGIAERRLVVVYNGINPPNENIAEMNNPYKDDIVNVLFVGRFDYQKGIDILLSLAERLDDSRFHITVVGAGVNDKCQPVDKPNITYVGWLPAESTGRYYYHADVLFMPSRWESFGLVAVEAQGYGIPVVASNCASLPEVISEGITGYLFETDETDAAYEIISTRNKEDWKRMQADCISFYIDNFTSDKMIKGTRAVYNSGAE